MKRIIWFLPLVLAIPLFAVTPLFWEVSSYDDFRRGKLERLSITSTGDLILAPRFDAVFNTEQALVWTAVADQEGNIYVGTGHDGKIFKVDSTGTGSLLADLPELDVLALAVDRNGRLFAGTSPDGKVYRIGSDGKADEFFKPDVKYIWSMVFDSEQRLLVATGDKGVIYRVRPDGQSEVFYDSDETHIVSMTMDRAGNVIAGGDPKGYVYRIGPEGKAFVLYDSGMREVHSVAIGADGRVYAAALSGRPSLTPTPPPPVTTTSGSAGDATVSITVSDAAAQNIDVVDATQQIQPDVSQPSNTRRGIAGAKSAIFEILTDGTVNTVWRSNDEMVFSLLPRSPRLLFSTGTKGRVYAVEGPRDVTLVAESTEEQTTSLLEVSGKVVATTANVGKLFRLDDVAAMSGTYESTVRDTEAISTWGKLVWKGQNASLIEVSTRTGNTSTPDKTWSDWAIAGSGGAVGSPRARFIQWKAVLKADQGRSAILSSLTLPYLQQNFRPELSSVDVLQSGISLQKIQTFTTGLATGTGVDAGFSATTGALNQRAAPRVPPRRMQQKGAQALQWRAEDKNGDSLLYDLYYRAEGEREWRLLKKGVEENFHTIESDTVPDGTYLVRIVASDHPSNPRDQALDGEIESRPFIIDNTPPDVTMRPEIAQGKRIRLSIQATDATSILKLSAVSINAGEWRTVFPVDGILDSLSESFDYLSDELPSGEHVIAFRVYDQNENVGMSKLVVRVP